MPPSLSPPPASAPLGARPLRTGLYLLTPLAWVLLAGLAALGTLAAAARWVLLTEEGTAWLLARLPIVSEVRGVQGALLGERWQIEHLKVQWDGGQQWLVVDGLTSEGMVWRWRPRQAQEGHGAGEAASKGAELASGRTLWAALGIERLQVRRLQVETGPRGPRPIPLPAHLAPPFRLAVAQLAIGELRVDALAPVAEIQALGLVLDGQTGARHRVEHARARAYGVQVHAAASITNQRPFALEAQATVAPALVAVPDAPPWAAALHATGPLAAFDLRAVLRGRPALPAQATGATTDAAGNPATARPAPEGRSPAPPTAARRAAPPAAAGPAVDLQALVRPLEAWPVHRLNATTQGLNLAALHNGAPHTRLSGEVLVQAAARDAPVSVQVRLSNLEPGRWDELRLPASRIELEAQGELARPDRVELKRFDVQLAAAPGTGAGIGGSPTALRGSSSSSSSSSSDARGGAAAAQNPLDAGRIEGRAVWSAHQIELDARLTELRPHRLDSRAPAMALAGPLHLSLSGLPSPDPGAKGTPAPWGVTTKLALEGRIEGAPRPVAVRAEGSASAKGLELRHLQVSAGDAQAVLRATVARNAAREWTLASVGSLAEFDPLPWWPGEANSPWRRGPHRLNAGWQFELRAPADAAQLAPLALAQRLAGNGQLRLHDSLLAGVPMSGEVTLGYRAAGAGAAATAPSSSPAPSSAPAPSTLHAPPGPSAAQAGSLRADLLFGGNRLLVEGVGDPAAPTADAGERWRLEVRATALATLEPLTRLHPALVEWVPRQGQLNADISAAGRWPHMSSQGHARSEDLQIGPLALGQAQANWRIDFNTAEAGDAPLSFDGQMAGLRLGTQRLDSLRAELRGTRAAHRLELGATLPVAPSGAAAKLLGLNDPGVPERAGPANPSGTRARLLAQGQWLPEPGGGGRWLARVDELDLGPTTAGTASLGAGSRPAAVRCTSAGGAPPNALPSSALTDAAASALPGPTPATRWAQARDLRAQVHFDAQGQVQRVSAEPGRVRLADTFALHWEAVELDFKRPRADFTLRADIEPFAPAPLLARLQPTLGWQGDLCLAAHVELRAAERFEADLVFARTGGDLHVETQGELQLLGLTDLRLLLKVREGLWDFEPVFRGRGLGEVRGRLRVRTTPERRWPHDDATVEGQLQARVANIGVWGHWLPPGWRLAGELATVAQLGGRFAEPTYTGELTGKGLAVRNLLEGVNVRDGQLLVRLAGSNAQIESFTLRGGEGRVEVTGTAELGAEPSARLKLSAQRFRVLGRVDRMLTASGQAELVLAAETSRLEGRFKIDEGLFDFTRGDAPSLDEDVTVRGTESQAGETGDAARAESAAAAGARARQRFFLDVDVNLGEQLRAKGRGIDTGLTGALHITNPAGRLAVRGHIGSVQGTYAAYGQKLELERGVITFNGPPGNPWLDIAALRPNLDLRVGLLVSGPLQGLRVRLFSEPEMSEPDKLSWLVLGRASEGLGRNDTALLQRAAVALLAGEGEAPTDAFMRRLGIDELSLKQSDGDVRETVVSLGKQLSRRWYVGYERGVNATTGTWQLIYRAAQRFTLRAQSGLENSLDLIWTWRLQPPPPAENSVRKSLPAVPP